MISSPFRIIPICLVGYVYINTTFPICQVGIKCFLVEVGWLRWVMIGMLIIGWCVNLLQNN